MAPGASACTSRTVMAGRPGIGSEEGIGERCATPCAARSSARDAAIATMHATSARRPPQDITFQAKGEKLRFDMAGPHGQTSHTIFEPGTKKILTVMDAQKMYMEVDLGQIAARGAAPATPGHDAPRASVNKTGKHETIAGYDPRDPASAQVPAEDS